MNIKEIFNKKDSAQKEIYASLIRRSTAIGIDIFIVLILRAIAIQILGLLFLNKAITDFHNDFSQHFGTELVKNNPDHINFVINHYAFYYGLIFYAILIFIGMIYHAYLNSSAWCGTIGKRIIGIVIVRKDSTPITLARGFAHYVLSVLPFLFIIYLISYQITNSVTLFQAVTDSKANLFFSIVFTLWMQIHLFTKQKTTAYDLICDTVFINGKTNAKRPWSK
jgi:uncharacterized RDD family membrane protein YckC